AVNNAKLVFVFDDAGQNMNHLEKFMNLPFPITVAVLPKLTYSRAAADRIRKAGKEVILHQPMQALNLNVNPGPGAITPDMSLYEIEMLVKENIAEVGSISGMNNHEGSMITEDENRISVVMQTLSDMGLYFLDSRTTSQTRVPQAAMSLGLSYYERNVFIDNTQNIYDMVKEIEKGLNIANQKGLAIMIGHIWSANTLPNLLMELYPVLVKKGYKFTTVSKSGGLITP
ncbi:MAG: divergent polysaccharide deacetylase family protein, partial [Treponema sp.]|nr:divergent polysaccharide deacetylase family protein [Treponema sp.]